MKKTIRQLREAHDWTQAELGSRVGMSAVTVYNWERGEHYPTSLQLKALAKTFGVRMDDIDFWTPRRERDADKGKPRRRSRETRPESTDVEDA